MDINQIPPHLRSVPPVGDAAKDPDAGQVIGPHGEAPEDPVARGVYRGCLHTVVVVGIVLVAIVVLYRLFVAG